MCGICGIVRFDGAPLDRAGLERACAFLTHRGPDRTGTWFDHPTQARVALGATRLIVMDPAPAADQPMHDPSGRYHLVYNGEVYNFPNLRRELADAGYPFTTAGDTEVVLAGCIRWGTEALHRFNGMWAFAFYDSRTKAGFLSRDRFGVKPLVYSRFGRALLFASEIRALLPLNNIDPVIDEFALIEHLRYGYIAHPKTIYQGARRLPPGHYIAFSPAGASGPVPVYPPPPYGPGADCGRPGEFEAPDYGRSCRAVRTSLADAVAIRRSSDVPIGAFLSGGLDSSIVVAHLAEVSTQPVKTFAVGYAGHARYDETHYARLVARRFGTDHHELTFSDREVLDAIPRILDHLSEPVGDSSIIPTALVSEFARRTVTVALSGDGGDELFGGYWRYLAHFILAAYHRVPGLFRHALIEPLLRRSPTSKSSWLGNRARQLRKLVRATDPDPLSRHLAWSRIIAPEAESLFSDNGAIRTFDDHMLATAQSLACIAAPNDDLNRILAFDLRYQLPADMLHKVDTASMMHSLEVRTPFLDFNVVEHALKLPSAFKIDRGRKKRILVDAYRGVLPDEILDRSKQGFEVPIGEYLRGPLRELFQDTVTRTAIDSLGILSYQAVQAIYDAHISRRGEHADLLFALLSLCHWRHSTPRN